MLSYEKGKPLPDWKPAQFPENLHLTGKYVQLVPLKPCHAAPLFAANNHAGAESAEALFNYLPHGPFSQLDEYSAWVEAASEDKQNAFFAILDNQQNPIGVAAYLRIAPALGSIEVGHLCFSPLLQKTIMATEAMYLMMQWAFEHGYRRYEWKCNDLNLPSIRAAQRLGFSYEGTFRNSAVLKGHNRDTAWFSIIDEEWPEIKMAFEHWFSDDNVDSEVKQKESLSKWTFPLISKQYVQ